MSFEKLKYINLEGEIQYLPTWFINSTDKEIKEAINIVLKEEKTSKTYTPETIINENILISQLKSEGYKNHQIEQIIADIQCGRTLDSALQRV